MILYFWKTERMVKGKGGDSFQGNPKSPLSLSGRLIEFTFDDRIHLWVESRIVNMAFATTRFTPFNYWSSLKHVVNV